MAQHHAALLAALFALGCGGAPKARRAPSFADVPPLNPLETCKTTDFSRYARGADCRGVQVLFLSRDVGADMLRERVRLALTTYGFAPRALPLHVNGRDEPALAYHMGPADAPLASAITTAFAVPGSDEAIEAQCYAYGADVQPERCATLLDAFVAQGLLRGDWPKVLDDVARRTPLTFDLAGREVRLPSACDELGPYDVSCADGHVRVLVPDELEKLAPIRTIDLAATKDETLAKERDAPCALEGVATTCTLRRFRLPYGDELLSYRAAAVVRGKPVLLSCDVKKSRAEVEPGPICNQFFHFDEGVLEWPRNPEEEER